MNVNPVSFNGTYRFEYKDVNAKSALKLFSSKHKFQADFVKGVNSNNGDFFIHIPKCNEESFQKFLQSLDIKYKSINESNALFIPNIISRMIRSLEDLSEGNQAKIVDVKKFDSEYQKSKKNHSDKSIFSNPSKKYNEFKNFLYTDQSIEMPSIYLKKSLNGQILPHFYSGEYTFCVLRDMGLKKIPMAVEKNSVRYAEQLGLI